MAIKNISIQHCDKCPSRGQGIFCELGKSDLDELSVQKVTNNFKKGQTLFMEGNPPFGLYCISNGNIKLTKTGEDGKESIVRIACAGDVIGHRSVFTDEYYSATATAMDDARVCFIDKKYILKMVKEKPTVAYNLISRLGRDLGASEDKIASFSQRNVRERVAELLLTLKSSHGIKNEENATLINLKLTREEMASLVGTATETLIRFMSELKEEQIIKQQGKNIVILNEQRLIEFANLSY